MSKIAVTCRQMQRDIADYGEIFERLGLEVVCPPVVQELAGAQLIAALEDVVGVIAGDDQFSVDVFEACPSLKVVAKWGVGVDGIDLAAARSRGISVLNTPGAFDDDVADVSLAYLLLLGRDLVRIDRGVRAGQWPKPVGRSVSSMTVGVVGLGGIGRALARRLVLLGARVIGVDPSPESRAVAEALGVTTCTFDALLDQADAISINCPLTPETHHLFDRSAFSKVKPGLLLVNTGRGPVVEEAALVEALDGAVVAGAALDVLETEPPPADSPLRRFDNVVFGSHNASNTEEASRRVHVRALHNLVSALGLEWPADLLDPPT